MDAQLCCYLKKYNVPIENFIKNDMTKNMTLTDLYDFDFSYFEDICKALNLNTVEKMRFKKLIHELNDENKNIFTQQQIKQHIKSETNKIIQIFDGLTNDLNNRKKELIDELNKISQITFNTKPNMKFIYDHNNHKILKNMIHNFAAIKENKNDKNDQTYIQPPKIIASINNDTIQIDYKESNSNNEIVIEYKKLEIDEKNDDWNVMKNSKIIRNIEPLTTYFIRAKLHILSCDIWSEYSETIQVTTNWDCIWDESCYVEQGEQLEFMDNHSVYCNYECETVNIISKPILNGNVMKKVKKK
eukprot:461153_1